MRLHELKSPFEKSRCGSRQSLRSLASIDLSKRAEEIESRLQIEEQVNGLICEMDSCIQRIDFCSLPLELVHSIRTELDGLKQKVDLTFTALKAEQDEVRENFRSYLNLSITSAKLFLLIFSLPKTWKFIPNTRNHFRPWKTG